MLLIRCTQKLLKEFGARPDEAVHVMPGLSWHANLLRFDRRKCLLFTHDQTLFSVFLPSVTKTDYPHLAEMFGQRLFRAMRLFDFNQQQIETMLEQARELRFAKTNSRSVLGSMNDMKQMMGWIIHNDGGLAATDMDELTRLINKTSFKAIGYSSPSERMHTLLSNKC